RESDKKDTRLFVQTHPDVLIIPPDPPQMMIKVDQVRRVIETIYYRPSGARVHLHRLGLHERGGEFAVEGSGRAAGVRYDLPALGESWRTTSDYPITVDGLSTCCGACGRSGELSGEVSSGVEAATAGAGSQIERRSAGPGSQLRCGGLRCRSRRRFGGAQLRAAGKRTQRALQDHGILSRRRRRTDE